MAWADPTLAQSATGGDGTAGSEQALGMLAAALAVGLGSIGAAIAVAVVGSAAMGALSEKPELGGRALIFLGLGEGIAIYGLIVAIMILGKY
ncbi:MAG: F0F1 ATP synthase subunit C [Desulfuromonadales bacterium]|nr:F0F1 ATP synthase subunit C [Desulfuromonadales bacterium]NIS41002.1 F0F1 ATP synthase subunit C [Desulfuromonadales bacterium]